MVLDSDRIPSAARGITLAKVVGAGLEPAANVTLIETHISRVFLAGEWVYKCKKPVRFAFLDYSTPELRRHACAEEVRLNRRLAPAIYLGVEPVTADADGVWTVGGAGRVVDWCVVMKRLPDERMLHHRIAAATAADADMERLLDVLLPFYDGATRGPDIDAEATTERIDGHIRENFATLETCDHGLPRALVQRVRSAQMQFVQLHAELFRRRIAAGSIREGHGDLRPEHVCLLEPPVVFDCVEFSRELRSADVVSELAFLAMECDFLGAPSLGAALLAGYRRRSGDTTPEDLVSFYKSYRACIRGKVELLRAGQQSEDAAARSRQRGRRYLQVASGYTSAFHRPLLLVVFGATGTGKSTLAAALSDLLGAELLHTDVIRHERAAEAGVGELYSETMNRWTYDMLRDRAGALLGEAVSVVLDGTFRRVEQREEARRLARQYGTGALFILCQCPPDVARRRIAERRARGGDVSDATPDLHEVQRRELQNIAEGTDADLLVLDTTENTALLLHRILDRLQAVGHALT
jgi:aminoglycoside phosphotransferase family enzyme/predicted kinase